MVITKICVFFRVVFRNGQRKLVATSTRSAVAGKRTRSFVYSHKLTPSRDHPGQLRGKKWQKSDTVGPSIYFVILDLPSTENDVQVS